MSANLSIAEFYQSLKEPIKKAFEGQIFTVFGDVERVTPWKDNAYITLIDKDEANKYRVSLSIFVNATLLKRSFDIKPKMRLLVSGTVSFSPNNGIQLVARNYEDLGIGRLQRQIEEWKEECQGLFTRVKKPLPLICQKVAVISNPEIQGFEDFVAHLRFGKVSVFNTKMQGGETVSKNIANLIFKISSLNKFDCICIVRGGGSFTDLFAFNHPALLRAIAYSKVPVVTAIGHESDRCLCDEVADVRFSTPTDAGKALSSMGEKLVEQLSFLRNGLKNNFNQILNKNLVAVTHLEKQVTNSYAHLESLAKINADKKKLKRKNICLVILVIFLVYLVASLLLHVYISNPELLKF